MCYFRTGKRKKKKKKKFFSDWPQVHHPPATQHTQNDFDSMHIHTRDVSTYNTHQLINRMCECYQSRNVSISWCIHGARVCAVQTHCHTLNLCHCVYTGGTVCIHSSSTVNRWITNTCMCVLWYIFKCCMCGRCEWHAS